MQAERAHAAQHAPHVEQAGVRAVVREQAALDELQVVDELPGALVLTRASVVGGAQPLGDLAEEHPVRHAIVRGRRGAARRRNDGPVLLDPVADGRQNADAAAALAQLLRERLGVEEVAVDDQLVMARAALADGLGVHVGVAVHVAADPGTEVSSSGTAAERASSPYTRTSAASICS